MMNCRGWEQRISNQGSSLNVYKNVKETGEAQCEKQKANELILKYVRFTVCVWLIESDKMYDSYIGNCL